MLNGRECTTKPITYKCHISLILYATHLARTFLQHPTNGIFAFPCCIITGFDNTMDGF